MARNALPQVAAPDTEPGRPPNPRFRHRLRWVKWVAAVALLALLIGEAIYLWPRLHESWRNISEVHWGWLVASIWLQAISISGYARTQKQLLRAGGVRVSQRRSLSVIYAATAMATTLPAGQVFSAAFAYRQQRRWGASPIVASWQLAISGVIHASGLALLGVAGALLVGGSINPVSVALSLGAMILLLLAINYAATHPDFMEAGAGRLLVWANRLRKRPEQSGMAKVSEIIEQLESVELGRRDGALTLLWAVLHRAGDIGSLAFACYAVGADPRWAGILIVFAVGKAVGSIPFAPGGIVYVDATLITALTSAAGVPAAQAVAAAFVYRAISFILVAIVGWIVVLLFFRGQRRGFAPEPPGPE